MKPDNKSSLLPRWWMDGSGPAAMGLAANVIAAVMTWSRFRLPPHDGFGVLIVIALLANVVALDNCCDGTARHRSLVGGGATCGVVLALGFAAIAYGLAPYASITPRRPSDSPAPSASRW